METMQAQALSLAHETVAIRDINTKLYDCTHHIQDHNAMESKTLVFTRLLGHKLTIPNSGRWKIHTKVTDECWICKRYVMCLFFYSPSVDTRVHSSLNIEDARITEKLDQSLETDVPLIYGKFNDWKASKMIRVQDLA